MKNIKLILAFAITPLFYPVNCMDDKAQQNHEKTVKSLALVKDNYLSDAISIPGLQRIIAQYACEWNLKTQLAKFNDSNITEFPIIFSFDCNYLAFSVKSKIHIWDVENQKFLQTYDHYEGVLPAYWDFVHSLAFSPNKKYLASCAGRSIKIWNLAINAPEYSYWACEHVFNEGNDGHAKSVMSIAFSPNSQFLVSGGHDNNIKIWNINENRCIKTFKHNDLLPNDSVWKIAYSPTNNHQIVSGSSSGIIKIWDIKTNTCLATFDGSNFGHTQAITALAYSPNGQYIASGSDDTSIKIFDINANTCQHTFNNTNGGHTAYISAIAYSSNGQYLISGSYDNSIKIFDLSTNTCIYTLDHSKGGHTDWVRSITCSLSGRYFASSSKDGTIKIWINREHELLDATPQN